MMGSWYASLFETGRLCWVCLGLATLVLAAVAAVLARFRFIQSRPLSACVVLSILAHVLLCLAAYFMQLFDTPQFPGGTTITMRLVPDSEAPVATAEELRQEEESSAAEPPQPPEFEPAEVAMAEPSPLPESSESPDTPAPPSPAEMEGPAVDVTPPTETEMREPPVPIPALDTQPEPTGSDPVEQDNSKQVESPPASDVPPLDVTATTVDDWFPMTPEASPAEPDREKVQTTVRRMDSLPSAGFPTEFAHRAPAAREPLLLRYGGNADTEAAVQAALRWLARHQWPDGRWSAQQHGAGTAGFVEGQSRRGIGVQADNGVTGLAILAFLGAGDTTEQGEYQTCVRRALDYLRQSQMPSGDLAGQADHFARTYCHGIATLAVGEASCLTGDTALRSVLGRALAYTQSSQDSATGGWRYRPGESGDTSQFGWQVMALASGEHAGFTISTSTARGIQQFLRTVSSGRYGGLASYRPHLPPTPVMTAEAAVCHLVLSGGGSPTVDEAIHWIERQPPPEGTLNLYYCYYGSMALHLSGSIPAAWNHSMQQGILSRQERQGPEAGSWPTDTTWGRCGGRVYTTAMAALCLEVYYRHLPLVDRTLARR